MDKVKCQFKGVWNWNEDGGLELHEPEEETYIEIDGIVFASWDEYDEEAELYKSWHGSEEKAAIKREFEIRNKELWDYRREAFRLALEEYKRNWKGSQDD